MSLCPAVCSLLMTPTRWNMCIMPTSHSNVRVVAVRDVSYSVWHASQNGWEVGRLGSFEMPTDVVDRVWLFDLSLNWNRTWHLLNPRCSHQIWIRNVSRTGNPSLAPSEVRRGVLRPIFVGYFNYENCLLGCCNLYPGGNLTTMSRNVRLNMQGQSNVYSCRWMVTSLEAVGLFPPQHCWISTRLCDVTARPVLFF